MKKETLHNNGKKNKLKKVFSRTAAVEGFGYYQEPDEHYVSYKNAVVEWTRYSESRDHNTNNNPVIMNPIRAFR